MVFLNLKFEKISFAHDVSMAKHASFQSKSQSPEPKQLELIHSDVFGLVKDTFISGYRYMMTSQGMYGSSSWKKNLKFLQNSRNLKKRCKEKQEWRFSAYA